MARRRTARADRRKPPSSELDVATTLLTFLGLADQVRAALAPVPVAVHIAEIGPAGSPPSFLALAHSGPEPTILVIAPDDFGAVEEASLSGEPPACASLAVVFAPRDQIDDETRGLLADLGWRTDPAPLFRFTGADGHEREFDGEDVAALARILDSLLAAGLADVVATPGPSQTVTLAAPGGGEVAVTWLRDEPPGPVDGDVFELRVTLEGVEPRVVRRLAVRGGLTLADLHEVLQVAIGWENCHLHEFAIGKRRFGPAFDLDLPAEPEEDVRLDAVLRRRGRLTYTYDFGDSWRHRIDVVAVRAPADEEPAARCLDGEGACPPEDSGGPWRYAGDLEDATPFVLADVQRRLDELFAVS